MSAPHWSQNFTEQYGGDASTRQVALADVTGPGTEYLRELDAVATGDVTYGKKAELLDVQYHEVTKQTGVLTKAIIAVASGGNAWLSFGLNTVADAAISGEINLENIVKDAAFTAVTAGFDVGGVEFQGATNWTKNALNVPSVYNPITGTRTAGYFSGTSLQNIAVDAGTNSLSQTAFYGGSLKGNLGNSLQAGLINESTGFAQNFVGDIKGAEGSPIGVIGHGIVGCISADVSGGNCGRGAVNAAAGEIATAWADKAYGQDRDKVKDLIGNTVNPILAAATSGGDLSQFSTNRGIADSQLQNNYLQHDQWTKFLDELDGCKGNEACIESTNNRYTTLSLINKEAMLACTEGAECQAHIDAMEEVLADPSLLKRALAANDNELISKKIFRIEKGDLTFGGAARRFGFDQVRSDLRIDDYPEWRAENCAAADSVTCLAGYNDANKKKLAWEGFTGPLMRQVEAPMAALSCVSGNLSLEACNNVLVMAGAEVITRGAGEIVVDLGGKITRIFRRTDGKTTSEVVEGAPKGGTGRPTPKESEQYVVDGTGGRGQVSYKDGDETYYSDKGSTRPDCVVGNCAIEVKNYDLSRQDGPGSLVRDTSKQVNYRAEHLPEGMTQEVRIDIRGQTATEAQKEAIIDGIVDRTNGNLLPKDIQFIE